MLTIDRTQRRAFMPHLGDTLVTLPDRIWWLALPALAIPALWPFYTHGLPKSFDGAIHLMRLALLDYHVEIGTLYPRWIPEIMLGRGAPILNYYASLTYYVAEAFHLANLDCSTALMAALALLVVLAGWGMYWLAKDTYGPGASWAALLAATAYMYAPYLLTNVFVRGAVAEVGAQAALPWVFWSLRRLMRESRPGVYLLPCVLSLAGLALSHNITLVLAPPMLAAYLLVQWRETRWASQRLGWLALAVLFAAGATAFFWAPVLFERGYLTGGAFEVAANLFLPQNPWHWNNFLNLGLPFSYNFGIPQLGLVQLLCAVAGAILARRRDAEWLFLIFAAIVTGLSIGAWALPLWLSNPVLIAVQFPWRLLTLMGLPLALLTGGAVLPLRRSTAQTAGAAAILTVVILANAPHLGWMETLPEIFGHLTPARIARYEKITGSMGGPGYTNEFTPFWAGTDSGASAEELNQGTVNIELHEGNAFALRATVTSATGGPLRLNHYYFPGWRAVLDRQTSLPVYASTGGGLVTVDIPAGRHELSLAWIGTGLERWIPAVSLLVLIALAGFIWRYLQRPYLSLVPLILMVLGAVMFYRSTPLQPIHPPMEPIQTAGMQLAGYRFERRTSDSLTIYPYWHLSSRQPDRQMRWQLRTVEGQVVNEITQMPYFDTARTSEWPAGTLLKDGVDLALPADLPAGTYQLYVQLEPGRQDGDGTFLPVGPIELPAGRQPAQQAAFAFAKNVQFGDTLWLAGYDLRVDDRVAPDWQKKPELLVVHAGDVMHYRLCWRAAGPISKDYRARVEMVDSAGIGITGYEQVAGGFLNEPTSWDRFRLGCDTYQLMVPADIKPGLYTVHVRAFDPDSQQQLEVTDEAGNKLGDYLPLHTAKAIEVRAPSPQHPASGHLGGIATLLGYDLPGDADLRPGSTFTVTLYYRAQRPATVDFTRSVQLVSPDLGMAAQHDSIPGEGRNPTRSWVAGEVIADTITLTVSPEARPGEYMLALNFYDLQANLQRMPLQDDRGQPLANDQFNLTKVQIR